MTVRVDADRRRIVVPNEVVDDDGLIRHEAKAEERARMLTHVVPFVPEPNKDGVLREIWDALQNMKVDVSGHGNCS